MRKLENCLKVYYKPNSVLYEEGSYTKLTKFKLRFFLYEEMNLRDSAFLRYTNEDLLIALFAIEDKIIFCDLEHTPFPSYRYEPKAWVELRRSEIITLMYEAKERYKKIIEENILRFREAFADYIDMQVVEAELKSQQKYLGDHQEELLHAKLRQMEDGTWVANDDGHVFD